MTETTELKLATTEKFGEVKTNIYCNKDNEMFMTAKQLSECLGFAGKGSFDKLISRNPYLKESGFSSTVDLTVEVGGRLATRHTRVFNEDGIYEVTFLANTDKAKEFRSWVRKILKNLRKGNLTLTNGNVAFTPQIMESIITQKIGMVLEDALNPIVKRLDKLSNERYINQYKADFDNNEWKNKIYLQIGKIMDAHSEEFLNDKSSFENRRECLKIFYNAMNWEYNFDYSIERSKYDTLHGTDGKNISVIEVIADNEHWREVLQSLIDIEIAKFKGTENSVPLNLPYEDGENVVEVVQTTTVDVPMNNDLYPELTAIIKPLAEKLNDNSKGWTATYRKVYANMNCDLKRLCGRYRNKHGLKRNPCKKKVIAERRDLTRKFADSVGELLGK